MRARQLTIVLTVILAFLATSNETVSAQKNPPIVSWYMTQNERLKLYRKMELWSSSPSQSTVMGFWITPAMARALVSYNIDREKIGPELAEARYQELRSKDHHLVLVGVLGSPINKAGMRVPVRLATKQDKVGIEGAVLKVPFQMPFVGSSGPTQSSYILAFPRLNARGERVISNLEDEFRVVLDYPGRAINLRCKGKRLASNLDDL